jgi:pimeloyl-ACP methyl ester carboxylesterase
LLGPRAPARIAIMPRLSVDGVGLHYEVQGAGDVVVLLHGFTGSHQGNWQRRGWLDLLADAGFRVAALDFRSHGQSDRVYDPAQCTASVLAGDVAALLGHLGAERADVVGFSMGGGVALQLAMDHPDHVRRLLVGGVGDAALNRLHDPHEIAELTAAFKAEAADAVSSANARRIRRNAELAGNELEALVPFLGSGGWPGGIGDERPVTAPLLVIVAEQDQYMRRVDGLLRWLAHAEVVRVPRDHHTVLDDEIVRARMLDFLGAARAGTVPRGARRLTGNGLIARRPSAVGRH